MASETPNKHENNPIEKIVTSVYPPYALLAGMQLDLFSPLKDRSMNTENCPQMIDLSFYILAQNF